MSLITRLRKVGSIFSFNGKKPTYISNPPLNPTTLKGSTLDLDGKTPPKYIDNLPK